MDKYAVVGNPIAHTLSPAIHTLFAEQTKQSMKHVAIEAPFDKFSETVYNFFANGGKAVNITSPFKEQAYELADIQSDLATQAHAANTLMIREDNSIYADSTDGIGLIQDLTHNHHFSFRQKRILLLGAGGAARAVIGPLLETAPTQVVIANRTPEKAAQIAKEFQLLGHVSGIGLDELTSEPHDLIINATSAGITGRFPELPSGLIVKHTWCYDMLYHQDTTEFIKWATSQGAAKCLTGIGMLVEQAAAHFYLWRGIYPNTQPVIEALTKVKT